jgi:5-methylcytosine-specific restriction endonuclease McrA
MYGSESSHKTMAKKGIVWSKETLEKRAIALRGLKRTPEQRQKMSLARLRLKIKLTPDEIAHRTQVRRENGWLKNPEKTKELMSVNNARANLGKSFSYEVNKKKGSLKEKNPNWQGGITPINEAIRKTTEYRMWRVSVFKRDDYTCQMCGKRGGRLHADHIKPFSLYPDLRLAIDNGRTLCVLCHSKTDTYGGKSHKKYNDKKIITKVL